MFVLAAHFFCKSFLSAMFGENTKASELSSFPSESINFLRYASAILFAWE
jgi:hypothetical protein